MIMDIMMPGTARPLDILRDVRAPSPGLFFCFCQIICSRKATEVARSSDWRSARTISDQAVLGRRARPGRAKLRTPRAMTARSSLSEVGKIIDAGT